jgi:hypothetical protein
MGNKKIDFNVNLENVIPTQLDVNSLELSFAQSYCSEFIVKTVDINDVEVPYILLDPDTLLNFIVSIIRNYDRYLDKLDY